MIAVPAAISRYWHTLRYLKPVQLYGRVWHRLMRPRLDLRPAPPLRARREPWVAVARRRQSLTGPATFRFLNEEHLLDKVGWDHPNLAKLWRYNLHYFDDLNASSSDSRCGWHRALMLRWVGENPPGRGTGWEPYPTSLRIVNWIKWVLKGNELPPECIHSLAVQARWLAKQVEWHLLGNHLFANAKALVFAGLFFEGSAADAWQQAGLRILGDEVAEQILSDGGQYERSPMYHALALEDMLDLQSIVSAFPGFLPESTIQLWREMIVRMRRWLAAMCHPDGEIAFFNDAAIGIAPSPAELEGYAERLGGGALPPLPDGTTHLAPSGYVRVQRGPAVALLDVAAVGPDYLPGHAHADTLSFELSLFGRRVCVNSGTSQYGVSAERLRQRGTAAHNTVSLAGRDSSEVWNGFRVARRARPFDLRVAEIDATIVVSCSHDGYQRLPGRPVHQREWCLGTNSLRVTDRVSGPFAHAIARFHLHPGIEVLAGQIMRLPGGEYVQWSVDGGVLNIVGSSWHPEFGMSVENQCIEIRFERPEVSFQLDWKQP